MWDKFIFGASGLAVGFAAALYFIVSQEPVSEAVSQAVMEMPMTDQMGDDGMAHDHPLLEVSETAPAPSVTHLVFPDPMGGYNIQILTDNFKITPASINDAPVENEGHAHLYVNGEKYTRIYSNWFHLPAAALVDGVNVVSVTLNANDHSQWSIGGVPIASNVRVVVPES